MQNNSYYSVSADITIADTYSERRGIMSGVIIVAMCALFFYMAVDFLFPEKKEEPEPPPEKTPEEKERIVRECILCKNIDEIAKKEGVTPDEIRQWKKELLERSILELHMYSDDI